MANCKFCSGGVFTDKYQIINMTVHLKVNGLKLKASVAIIFLVYDSWYQIADVLHFLSLKRYRCRLYLLAHWFQGGAV